MSSTAVKMLSKRITRANLPPLVYVQHVGKENSPNLLYVGGFLSTKNGGKPGMIMERYGVKQGMTVTCFDYTDKGESVWEDTTKEKIWSFEQWKNDALTILDDVTNGPQILIGSSMGAWIALLLAVVRPSRVAGVVLISSAVGFTRRIETKIPADLRAAYDAGDMIEVPSPTGGYPIRRRFIEEGNAHDLMGGGEGTVKIGCPVTLLHCRADDVAPYQCSVELQSLLSSPDVELRIHKTGGHRMMEAHELEVLCDSIDKHIRATAKI